MNSIHQTCCGLRVFAIASGLVLLSYGLASALIGCDAGTAALPQLVHSDSGFRVTPPAGWREAPANSVTVPGNVLGVWTPVGSSFTIVAFAKEVQTPLTASQVLASCLASAKSAGCTITQQSIANIAGREAVSIEHVGNGTGNAIGAGTTPTYQHWVIIPKNNQLIVLLATAADASKQTVSDAMDVMVAGASFDR